MTSVNRFDVIVVGGGHNGLVSAAMLARRGRRVVVLERRHKVGGAAVTETPWGPSFKMTALSYVVSLMPKTVLTELDLPRFGYKVYPQHGYFAPRRDGRSLLMYADEKRRHAELGRFSARDAEAFPRFDAWLSHLAGFLGPLLTRVPPRLGDLSARALLDQADLAWKLRGMGASTVADLTRLMTMSVADLLDDWFESDALKGVQSVSGVIGAWSGPRSPGSAYVMAHHRIGDVGDGQLGSWGFPEGGMGGVTESMRRSAVAAGVTIRTGASVTRITTASGRATGVVLSGGEELFADVVIATTHPKLTFLEHLDRKELPDEFVTAMERWKTRSGTVKVNFALDRLPEFTSRPGFDPLVHGGTIVLAESVGDLEQAFQDAAAGSPARLPFADICIPSVFDKTLAPEGKHVMSCFTQWVPHDFASAPHEDELSAYADRLAARMEEVAPGFTSSILHRQVIGPHAMETEYGLLGGNIFHGELTGNQLFHMRPVPGYADFTTPIRGLYQASSATHGGGGVTGIPAMQVVARILRG
jgi:phytoene dehydrogenase-like protein